MEEKNLSPLARINLDILEINQFISEYKPTVLFLNRLNHLNLTRKRTGQLSSKQELMGTRTG
jgi:hypothetical protein